MQKRTVVVDFVKGITVVLMSIVHVNSLFYLGKNDFLDFFTLLGATVCFSSFIFFSGFLVSRKNDGKLNISSRCTLKRILLLYGAYLFLSVVITLLVTHTFSLATLKDIALLIYLPKYTEFLVAFIFFAVFIFLFQKPVEKFLTKPIVLMGISILLYFIGGYLFSVDTNIPVLIWLKSHMVGFQDYHYFPLLSYLPIYTLGMVLGKYFCKKNVLASFVCFIIIFGFIKFLGLSSWYRWPASPYFLIESVLFVLGVLGLSMIASEKRLPASLVLLGKYSLHALVVCTTMIALLNSLVVPTSNMLTAILLNLLVIILTYIVIRVRFQGKS